MFPRRFVRRCRWWLSANGYLIRAIVIKWARGLSTLAIDARRARASFDVWLPQAMLRRRVERRFRSWQSHNGYLIKAIVLWWARDCFDARRARAKAIDARRARVCFDAWLCVWRLRIRVESRRQSWCRYYARVLQVILRSWPGRLPDFRYGWYCGYGPTTAWGCGDEPTSPWQ